MPSLLLKNSECLPLESGCGWLTREKLGMQENGCMSSHTQLWVTSSGCLEFWNRQGNKQLRTFKLVCHPSKMGDIQSLVVLMSWEKQTDKQTENTSKCLILILIDLHLHGILIYNSCQETMMRFFFIRSNEMLMFAKLPMYICSAARVPVVCGAGQHTSHFPGHTWPHWCLPAHTWAAQCHCCWLWLPRWHGVLHWRLPWCYQVWSLLRQNSKGSVLEKNCV